MYENGHDFRKGHTRVYTSVVLAASDFDITENPWAPREPGQIVTTWTACKLPNRTRKLTLHDQLISKVN